MSTEIFCFICFLTPDSLVRLEPCCFNFHSFRYHVLLWIATMLNRVLWSLFAISLKIYHPVSRLFCRGECQAQTIRRFAIQTRNRGQKFLRDLGSRHHRFFAARALVIIHSAARRWHCVCRRRHCQVPIDVRRAPAGRTPSRRGHCARRGERVSHAAERNDARTSSMPIPMVCRLRTVFCGIHGLA